MNRYSATEMRICSNKRGVGYGCLAALGLLAAAGCGDDRPVVTATHGVYRPSARVTPAADVTTPTGTMTDGESLPTPDPLAGMADDKSAGAASSAVNPTDTLAPDAADAAPDPLADAGTDQETTAPKMPTQHSHWLSLSQFGARVTVRLNGVWYGEFYGSALRDITMRLRPGPNALTVTYAPQSAEAWLAVHVTEGEHSPPIPDLVVYQVAPLRDTVGDGKPGRLIPTTRTFRFLAH